MHKKCFNCSHPGKDCIPYLMTMPGADLLAWCKGRKDMLRLSNAEIAARSNVPKGTIDRLFSSDNTDFRFSTIQPIICILTGCKPEDLDCSKVKPPVDSSPDPALVQRVHDLEHESRDLQKDLQFANKTISNLENSIGSWKQAVYGMMALCGVLVVSLLEYLHIDFSNTDIGHVRDGYTSPGLLLPVLGIAAVGVAAIMLIRYKLKSSKEKFEKP